MTVPHDTVLVEPPCGPLLGRQGDGLVVFRGVPYALPPTGERRFQSPLSHPDWREVRQALDDGPIPPQAPSRLSTVTGDLHGVQDEDCLTLTIWTPKVDAGRRPVLVWFHGGAYSSGAGSLDWYSGEALARAGNMVVVGVNFRLGALGLLCLEGVSSGNLSVQDQVAALQWVQRNIEAFGGDPGSVTAAGQSSGANAIVAILGSEHGRGLCRRAILQSPSIGRADRTLQEGLEQGERYRHEVAKLAGSSQVNLKTVAVEHLLAAQGPFAAANAGPLLPGETALPFMPVVDNKWVLPGAPAQKAVANGCVDLLVGTTREEMMAFHRLNPKVQQATMDDVRQVLAHFYPGQADEVLARYQRQRASVQPGLLLGDIFTDRFFAEPSRAYARQFAKSGGRAFVYQFDWPSSNGFAACHCLELPFVFGNLPAWHDAPMIAGVDAQLYAGLSRAMMAAWIAFITDGSPDNAYLPAWPACSPEGGQQMLLDAVFKVVGMPT